MTTYSMTLSRLAIGICGATVGFYAAFSAFRNGQSLAGGLDGIAFGSAFAAVVVGSWFLLPMADKAPKGRAALMRLGWALCLVFVLINAVGFTANHRTAVVGDKANAITAYDVALTGLKTAQESLTAMKGNARWQRTSGCTNATAEQSIEFCRQVQQVQADIAKFQPVVSSGRPATVDAQADTIAWVIQAEAGVVSKAMPIFMAVVLDIAASLFIWAALATYQTAPVAAMPKAVVVRKKRTSAKPKRKTAKQVNVLKKIAAKPDGFTTARKPDRRRKAAKLLNDNEVTA